ncbi:MAG: tRNA lysidine(34) synthetase TilS [Rhizobiales bacterium 24-66-13]|nr:MAG: tRNA lysidine(34) synthetase TilS [Rhizobiales bacterium 35-66-30]OYZ79811.1 MAG: tRNA lysidine(34) synthetase TilS [Rhizobiales bacterium 24-66-13]OZB02788.1 MAG: tRNA lysidine(34) synthetase TilS [Rhizobiales bacterium 39-66-18]HQS11225.1 tRNA lysidine(34) synthetase TilS [Xanthobacteraceae bacterium]
MPAAEVAPSAPRPVEDDELPALFSAFCGHPAVLLACSGGPDSTALIELAARWARLSPAAPALFAATVDHGLRAAAAEEAQIVAAQARRLGIPHAILNWAGPRITGSIQARARTARYALLVGHARQVGAQAIVTAHTLDDQAETILMRLARGSGLSGLAGMAASSRREGVVLLRPLLAIPKAHLIATLEASRVGFVRDPSNANPAFTRVRLRAMMPQLAGEGLDAAGLSRFGRRMARAEAALEQATDHALADLAPEPWPAAGPIRLARAAFFNLPEEIALRVLLRLLDAVGDEGPVELAKLERLLAALSAAQADGRSVCATLAGGRIQLAPSRLEVARALPRRARRVGNSA